MSTISVPLPAKMEEAVNNLIKGGYGANKADVVRRAIAKLIEDQAVLDVLAAEREPTLRGDLRKLAKKFK